MVARRKDYGNHEMEVDEEEGVESTSWLLHLPSVILVSVMKLLSEDFTSIRNLSYTCKYLRSFILKNIKRLYISHLDIDNFDVLRDANYENAINYKKSILSLKITTSYKQPSIPLANHEILEKRTVGGDILLDKQFYLILEKLDKSNLKSLEIRTNLRHYERCHERVKQSLIISWPQSYLESLEVLKMDINLINLSIIYTMNWNVLLPIYYPNIGNILERFVVVQVLQPFHQFLDHLYRVGKTANVFRELEINLIPQPDCDWFFYLEMPINCWSDKSFDEKQEDLWKTQFFDTIKKYKGCLNLKQNYTRLMALKGIPFFFFNILLEFVYPSLQEATSDWEGDHQKFTISTERHGRFFDMTINFY